jgi:RNA polymerase sigma-70 factor (ECF subfamily)
LFERVRSGSTEAWQSLVLLYSPLVRFWCHRAGITDCHAEDVVQEVFQAVTQGLGQYRSEAGTFRSWLRGITRHKVVDSVRDRARQPNALGGSEALDQMLQVPDPDADPDPDSAEERTEIDMLMRRGLELVRNEFAERTWRAFWCTAVDGRDAHEVSAEFGKTARAVRVAKSRVVSRLREELQSLM